MASPSQVETGQAFFDILDKSRLLSAAELAEARTAVGERDARSAARHLIKQGQLTRWQAAQLLTGWHLLRLGKYKLCDQIGRSDLGRVFLAEHEQMGRKVAIKTLARQHTTDKARVEQFLRDAREAAAIDHRNVIHLYDIDQESDRYYLVMEYVQGSDLQNRVEKQGPLSYLEVAELVQQAAEGLDHVHRVGLVHGDIRPKNLMVDKSLTLKILGLGVGQLAAATKPSQLSDQEPATGLADYLSPEQAREAPIEPRSDIYSLGCVMYFLLSGQVPYAGETSDQARVRAHQTKNPPSLESLREDVPLGLSRICQKMMAKKMDDRFRTGEAVSQAVQRWMANFQPPESQTPEVVAIVEDEMPVHRMFERKRDRGSQVSRARSANWRRWSKILGLAAGGIAVAAGLLLAGMWIGNRNRTDGLAQADRPPVSPTATEGEPGPQVPDPADGQPAAQPSEESATKAASSLLSQVAQDDKFSSDPFQANAAAQPATNGDAANATKAPADPPAAKDANAAAADAAPDPQNDPAKTAPPEPDTEPPTEPDTDSATPDTTPPPAVQPRANPFASLAAAIALPEPASESPDQPVDLGPLKLDASDICLVKLRGGETAARSCRFQVREAGPPTVAARQWELTLQNSDAATVPIARLDIQDDRLRFQWQAEAAKESNAAQLINCALVFSNGSDTHNMLLRAPVVVSVLALNFERGVINERLNVNNVPDGEHLTLEILGVDGVQEKTVVEPANAGPVDQDGLWIAVGERADERVLAVHVDVRARRTALQLIVTPRFRLAANVDFTDLNPGSLKKAQQASLGFQQQWFQKVQQLRAIDQQIPNGDRANKQLMGKQIEAAERELAQAVEILNRAQRLTALQEAWKETAQLRFRISYDAEGIPVTLVETQ